MALAARYAYLATLVAGLGSLSVAAEQDLLSSARESITAAEMRRHVEVLAGDAFEGRAAGSRGGHAAAVYLAQQFEKYKLAGGASPTSYFQVFSNQYRNLLGLLEGSDPTLREQVIVVSAHYDHVGYGNSQNSYGPIGYIHNGADDNASGDAGLLELVEAFTKLEQRPKRSILFAMWDGEEGGLLGSKHWVANPTLPLSRVAFMVNMDMIGRLTKDGVKVFGSRSGRGLRRLVSMQNQAGNLKLDFDWDMKRDSDHWSFFERGIPILMFHTGLHGDWHRPSDDVEKLDFDGMQRIGRTMFGVINELANEPELPKFRQASRQESSANCRALERPLAPPPPRLGLAWDPADKKAAGLKVTEVSFNLPAQRAGVRAGDRILKLNDHTIESADGFQQLVLAAKNPTTLTIAREGIETPIDLKLELAGDPVRIGIAWAEDEGDPGNLVLTQVVPNSPADKAGLRLRDRIEAVDGHLLKSAAEFHQIVKEARDKLQLTVEHDGQERTVELKILTP